MLNMFDDTKTKLYFVINKEKILNSIASVIIATQITYYVVSRKDKKLSQTIIEASVVAP